MPVKLASAGRDVVSTECAGRTNGGGRLGADVPSREARATLPTPRTVAEAAALLATIPPFSELSPVERARLAPALEEVIYAEGGVIFPQGTAADALYILRKGQARRFVDGVLLDTVRPHSVFGGVELLCSETRSSTLVAAPGCVVWRLPADRFAASSWVLVVAVLAIGGSIASTGLLYRPRPEDGLAAGAGDTVRPPSPNRGVGGFARWYAREAELLHRRAEIANHVSAIAAVLWLPGELPTAADSPRGEAGSGFGVVGQYASEALTPAHSRACRLSGKCRI